MRDLLLLTSQCFRQLSKRGRRVIIGYLVSLITLASLDGVALFLLAKLLSTNSVVGNTYSLTNNDSTLLFAIIFLFISRSALSTLSTWFCLKEFAEQEVEIGQKRLIALHEAKLESRLELNESDYFTAIDRGPTNLVQGVLVCVVSIFAEAVSGLVILGVVLVIQPVTALAAFTYFVLIAVVQHNFLARSQTRAGREVMLSVNGTYDLLSDYFHMDKLLHVSKSQTFESALRKQRSKLANARVRQTFISSLPRYFMESMLALGFLVIGTTTWLLVNEAAVLPALAIFAAAGFRLLPIVNRIQGLALSAIGSAPLAKSALIPNVNESVKGRKGLTHSPIESDEVITVVNLDFTYPSGAKPVLQDINLSFKKGLQYAIVGPSGSGKTTLIDICLGLLEPQKGEVIWKFREPIDFFGYVPQDTHISSASIVGNVALEWDSSVVDIEKVNKSLKKAQLEEFISPSFTNDELNENFNKLSGGQRQRLGLARALYRDSKLLVLDEATSSLDVTTESKVMESVKSLRGSTTVIIVAHRLTTIKDADQVIYLEGGKVMGIGTFNELQRVLPQFKEQVRLGLLVT